MIKIHGARLSPYVRKVLIALEHYNLPYEVNPVVPFADSKPFLFSMNPLGKIPILEDNDFILPDSSVICAYIARKNSRPDSIYPQSAREFGKALWYEEYADSRLIPTLLTLFFQNLVVPKILHQPTDSKAVETAEKEEIPQVLSFLDAEIKGKNFLLGNNFSIADIAIFSPFINHRYGGGTVDMKKWPNVARYVATVEELPAVQKVLQQEQDAAEKLIKG